MSDLYEVATPCPSCGSDDTVHMKGASTVLCIACRRKWLAPAPSATPPTTATDDLKLARFWTARENLRRLAEAGPGVGAALTPIPGMVRTYTPPPREDRDDEPAPTPVPSSDG